MNFAGEKSSRSDTTYPEMKDDKVLKIDLQEVLHERLPKLSRFIPNALVGWAENTICQEQLNTLLEENAGKEGAEFCRGVFRSLNISYRVHNEQKLPSPENRRVVFVSNHPLGALDGMMLIDYVQQRYGGQVWFVVNDLLMHVSPLKPVFLPVNKFGTQSRRSIRLIDEAFAGNDPIIIFPAGLVSRLQNLREKGKPAKQVIADLAWKKMFVTKSAEYHRDVIPLFFSGLNSLRFYQLAARRKKFGLRVNIEQIYLPREIFNSRGKEFGITFGNRIKWQTLAEAKDLVVFAQAVKRYIYTRLSDRPIDTAVLGDNGDNPAAKQINDLSLS